jgi:lysophospholipase L1-like esterase
MIETMALTRPVKFVIYIACLFISMELLSRMFLAIPQVFDRIVPTRLECDAARRLRWMDEYNNRKNKLESGYCLYHPTRGWALKPNINDMKVYDNKVLNSNSRGIRGTAEYSYTKNPSKTRILVLGDSFTFGEEVSDNETYPCNLQQLLPNTEIINFGMRGYGHDQMLIYLQEEGIKYEPDVVILGFLTPDTTRNMLMFRDYAKPKFILAHGQLILVNSPVPSPQEIAGSELYKSKFLDLMCILYCKIMMKTQLYDERKNNLTEAILDEISATIKRMHATPVFVFLDAQRSINTIFRIDSPETKFSRFCEHSGVAHRIFLSSCFAKALQDGIILKTTRHFNPQENRIVAQGIGDYLIAHNLINITQ